MVNTLVFHGTASKKASGIQVIENWLRKITVMASYHYLIDRDGTVFKAVAAGRKAWHAGISKGPSGWGVNNYSIGIAFVTDEKEPITREQMASAVKLTAALSAANPALEFVTRHKDIAPGRKSDPAQLTLRQISEIERAGGLRHWTPLSNDHGIWGVAA